MGLRVPLKDLSGFGVFGVWGFRGLGVYGLGRGLGV